MDKQSDNKPRTTLLNVILVGIAALIWIVRLFTDYSQLGFVAAAVFTIAFIIHLCRYINQ